MYSSLNSSPNPNPNPNSFSGELKAIRRRFERKENVQLFPVSITDCEAPNDCFYANEY